MVNTEDNWVTEEFGQKNWAQWLLDSYLVKYGIISSLKIEKGSYNVTGTITSPASLRLAYN